MAKPFSPQVATANHLLEGDVIYFTNPGWSRDLTDATVAHDADAAEDLLAKAAAHPLEIAGAYLADVVVKDGIPTPAHFREAFRTLGPSNYFHGKQADHV